MSDLMGLFGAIGAGAAPDVADKIEVDGLKVSTVCSYDMGWETAILDANSAYPVERYDSEQEAAKGHLRWAEKAKTLKTVTQLGYGDLVGDEEVTLERMTP